MNSIEALNELIDEIKYTHNDGKTLTDYDAKLVKIIEKDLEALELFRNAIQIEHKIVKVPKGEYINFEMTTEFVTKSLKAEQIKVLTKWIIENIDKETVRKWLENDINLY